MNEQTAETSPFASAKMPSSALIDKLLRALPDGPDVSLTGQTVDGYCRRIQESARILSKFELTENLIDRAESFRYLLTMTAYAVDAALLNCDPLEPMFSQPYRLHLLDWGAASPDAVYRRAMVRDDHAYRVYGRIGNAPYLSMDFRQSSPARTITRDELPTDADGNFEIYIGGPEREKYWWPMHTGTTGLLVREFFDDWLWADKSRLRIECLDGGMAPRPEHRSNRVAAEFDMIGDWILEGAIRFWIKESHRLAENPNAFGSDMYRSGTKLPDVYNGWWDLRPDEALLIELSDPRAEFWGLQLATSLWHTLDYANRLTTINQAQAHRDADGVYRLVLSAGDPGVHNWLDTTGLKCGVLILRLAGATAAASPRTTVVPLSQITGRLPESKTYTPGERRAQIADRREGVSRMLCD
jgi:hypothetical protein